MSRLFIYLATLGPLGHLVGSGTVGSLVAIFFVFLNNYFLNLNSQAILISSLIIVSLIIINLARRHFIYSDPKEIIIDEFVGCLIACFGIPFNLTSILLAFILFRFFDITKSFGICYIEKFCKGSFGILFDDVIAGLFANLCIRFFVLFGLLHA